MTLQTHQVRLHNGTIGDVRTTLKPNELHGRFVLAITTIDGETVKRYGTVSHVYEQHELDL